MTRYRKSEIPGGVAFGISFGKRANGIVNWSNNASVTVNMPLKEGRYTYDEEVINYHKRSAAGEIFNNPFSSSYEARNFSGNFGVENFARPPVPVSSTLDSYQIGMKQFGSGLLPIDSHLKVDFPTLENDRNVAIVDCLSGVNQTDFDTSAFMAEWDKTRRIHREVGSALLKVMTPSKRYVKRAKVTRTPVYDIYGRPLLNRRGDPIYRYFHDAASVTGEGALNRAKTIANAYLVGRMALAPLLVDLENACKLLAKSHPKRHTARGRVIQTGQASQDVRLFWDVSSALIRKRTTRVYEERYGILYESNPIAQLAANLGFSRPLSTAWELTPYSFVVDAFVNVGSWLDALQPSLASKTLSAWVSTRDNYVTTFETIAIENGVKSGWTQKLTCNLGGSKQTLIKNRSLWTPDVPKLPPLGTGFNNLRCFDYASLVMQKINTRL